METGLPGWVFKGTPVSVGIKGIIPVQFNKAACIITVPFTSWKEIESLRSRQRKGERCEREREKEVDKPVNKEEIIRSGRAGRRERGGEGLCTVASLFLLSLCSKLGADSEA